MSRVDLTLQAEVERTSRVQQLEGMFDLPEKRLAKAEFHFDVPLNEREWKIGLIVGPSGAGKSQTARHMFGDAVVENYGWSSSAAIVDGFGSLPIRDIVGALSAVGFASPPGWLKPYQVLSNGERFRCNLARALVDERPLVVFDEFTSVVDRQVARIGAHACAKAVRARPGKQFVAVTCHEDVLEWLQPDWVLEPHIGKFSWRELRQRPEVELEVVRCSRRAWPWFAAHHYLSADLNPTSRCFAGLIDGSPAAFGAVIHFPHPKVRHLWRLHRVVVLPDYQGLGLGAHGFTETLGAIIRATGRRCTITTSHPALIRTWAKSSCWSMKCPPHIPTGHTGHTGHTGMMKACAARLGRRVASFEYVGVGLEDREVALRLWEARVD